MMRILICLLALLTALQAGVCSALSEEAEEIFVENEWNYVDGTMDISGGIPENAEGVLGRVRSNGVLRVATEPYFPPQEFIDESLEGQDRYVGSDMAMARVIAQSMGVELEIVPMEFTDVLNAVAEDRCDLAISGLAYTPSRAAMVELSRGYHYGEGGMVSGIVIRAGDAESITGIDDLAKKTIVAQSGSLQEALTAENVSNYLEFRRLPTVQDVYQAVIDGRADAGVVDIETTLSRIAENPEEGLTLIPDVRFQLRAEYDGDRVAAKKGEIQLLYFVNTVIEELLASGQYESWFRDYGAYAARLEELGLLSE